MESIAMAGRFQQIGPKLTGRKCRDRNIVDRMGRRNLEPGDMNYGTVSARLLSIITEIRIQRTQN